MGQWFYNCIAYAGAQRAPTGQLDASAKLFELIASTFRVDPEWQARVTKNAMAIQQIEQKGIRDRVAIQAKSAEDIRKIQQETYENQQKSQDSINANFSQVIRGVESYRNPTNGETLELDANYGHAWVNNRGEYLLSDQAGFDPNIVAGNTLELDRTPAGEKTIMNRTARMALALLLSLAAGCHRDNKEAQLRALDEAYQVGRVHEGGVRGQAAGDSRTASGRAGAAGDSRCTAARSGSHTRGGNCARSARSSIDTAGGCRAAAHAGRSTEARAVRASASGIDAGPGSGLDSACSRLTAASGNR